MKASSILYFLLPYMAAGLERRQIATNTAAARIPSSFSGSRVHTVSTNAINEASGLAASRKHPGILYVMNDNGDRPRVFALNASDASLVATFEISPGVTNHDWEDLAVGPCGQAINRSCLYIADTGSGPNVPANKIYRIMEPDVLQDQTIAPNSVLKFNWTEPEADTLMVDPKGELYVIGKVLGGRGMIVHLPSSAWGQADAVIVSSTSYLSVYTEHHDPVAGDISADGRHVLVKTKNSVFYWYVADGNYLAALVMPGQKMPYIKESLGEAICWSKDGASYYTLGEGHHRPLYIYM